MHNLKFTFEGSPDSNELAHYGVLGMKWGVRRYQNKDGSLTRAGIERYRKEGLNLSTAQKGFTTNSFNYEGNAYGIRDNSALTKKESSRLGDKSADIWGSNASRLAEAYSNAEKAVSEINDKQVINQGLKELKKEFVSPKEIDDKEYLQMVAEDIAGTILFREARKTPSGKKADSYEKELNGWFDDAKKTSQKIVNAYGGDRVLGFDKTKQIMWSKVVEQTLLESQVDGMAHAARHGIFEDSLYNSDEFINKEQRLANELVKEFYKLK